MSKKYIVYIEIPDDCYCVRCGSRYTKIGAILLSKKIKRVWKDIKNTPIYDREKGEIIYEK